jgi:prevent-host-death family protein
MSKTMDITEAQAHFGDLLKLVSGGTEVILSQGDSPVAKVVPISQPKKKKRVFGLHPGAMTPSADFNDPLPDEFWLGTDTK